MQVSTSVPEKLILIGLFVVLFTIIVQATIATMTKARENGSIPGAPPKKTDQMNFAWRAYRAHMNSLENLPLFLGAFMMAMLSSLNSLAIIISVWIYAGARIVHGVLYYLIATDKNPSPRSWFFLIALTANVALLLLSLYSLITGGET